MGILRQLTLVLKLLPQFALHVMDFLERRRVYEPGDYRFSVILIT